MKSQQVILAATPLCRLVDARSSMIQATRHSDLAVAFNRQGKARVNRVDAGLATRLELGHYCIETAFPQHAPCSHPPDRARVFAGKRQGRGVRTAPKDRDWPGDAWRQTLEIQKVRGWPRTCGRGGNSEQ